MKILRKSVLFAAGGTGYVLLEFLWRGWSHISMFLAGGLCFLLVGHLEETEPKLPAPVRPLAGAGIITMVELAAGLAVNRDYTVWDYRSRPGNFCGQICPLYAILWIGVAWAGAAAGGGGDHHHGGAGGGAGGEPGLCRVGLP